MKVGSTFPSAYPCDVAVSDLLLYVLSAQEQDRRRRQWRREKPRRASRHCEARGRGAAGARAERGGEKRARDEQSWQTGKLDGEAQPKLV